MTSTVSVIMPTFNSGPYIEQAIRSVLDQTFRNLEIIVIDDGTTDSTPSVLERLSQEDSRVRVIRQEKFGATFNWNNLTSNLPSIEKDQTKVHVMNYNRAKLMFSLPQRMAYRQYIANLYANGGYGFSLVKNIRGAFQSFLRSSAWIRIFLFCPTNKPPVFPV